MAREIKDFNRLELKYVVPHDMIQRIVSALGEYIVPDPNNGPDGGYPIYSIYADSPNLACFWEKIEGLKFRRKVRFRRYGESDQIWMEIKQRIDRTVQKRRLRWPLERVHDVFFNGRLPEEELPDADDRVLQEILFLWRHYDLRPVMGTSYQRQAYFAANESDLRITFDTRVCFHPSDLTLSSRAEPEKVLIPPDQSILEVKYNHTVPLWLVRQIAAFDLPMIRMSKYCTAVDKEYFGGELT
ncbi:MAG: polyphosphate polymerase domain-containing protein [Deltaproteobacteria bacterium]|nr:polyphosphate polymerase domain-containing protein [Deltaproteobacteria bacterium]